MENCPAYTFFPLKVVPLIEVLLYIISQGSSQKSTKRTSANKSGAGSELESVTFKLTVLYPTAIKMLFKTRHSNQ
jgi:hypothetical protein